MMSLVRAQQGEPNREHAKACFFFGSFYLAQAGDTVTDSHALPSDEGRVSDRAKRSGIVLRREVTKARRNEAECKRSVEAHISTMLWEVMTVNHDVAGSSPAGGAMISGQKSP